MRVMHSMELDDEDKLDTLMPIPMDKPDYPCNLHFSLTQREFKKLPELDEKDAVKDGTFHFWGMAKITSVNHGPGDNINVECQMTDLGIESEDAENEGD